MGSIVEAKKESLKKQIIVSNIENEAKRVRVRKLFGIDEWYFRRVVRVDVTLSWAHVFQ